MSKRKGKTTIKRRTVVAAIGVGAGALAIGAGAVTAAKAKKATKPVEDLARNRPVPSPGPEVKALFGDLGVGSKLGPYSIAAIYPVRMGAVSVVMKHARKTFQVDVLRRDDAGPSPVGKTPSLALFLANQGKGDHQTDEVDGIGVMALAAALAEREASGARVPELLSLDQRASRFPQGDYGLA